MALKPNKAKKNVWKQQGWKAQFNLLRLIRKLDLDPDYRQMIKELDIMAAAPVGGIIAL